MTTSLADLLAQRAILEQKISDLRSVERISAISKIHSLIEELGLTQKDIFPPGSSRQLRNSVKTKVAPKYRDPISGKTWSGRGLAPKWIGNQDKKQFLII